MNILNHDSIKSLSESFHSRTSDLARNLIERNLEGRKSLMKNKDFLDQDKIIEKSLTPKVFIANVKSKIQGKFTKFLESAPQYPRSMVYTRTIENLKSFFEQSPKLKTSSLNDLEKMDIKMNSLETKNIQKSSKSLDCIKSTNKSDGHPNLDLLIVSKKKSSSKELQSEEISIPLYPNIVEETFEGKIKQKDSLCPQTSEKRVIGRKCPNFTICENNGHIDKKSASHRVIKNCPINERSSKYKKTHKKIDQKRSMIDCCASESEVSYVKNQVFQTDLVETEKGQPSDFKNHSINSCSECSSVTVSIPSDVPEVKELFQAAGIKRIQNNNTRFNVEGKKKNLEKLIFQKKTEASATQYTELKKSYAKLQGEFDQLQLENSKLSSENVQRKKSFCPTKGCSGQGNVNNENFEGHHNALSSCPIAFLINQNKDSIEKLRIENFDLKTKLNLDLPRHQKENENLKSEIEEKNTEIRNLTYKLDRNMNDADKSLMILQDDMVRLNQKLIESNSTILNLSKQFETKEKENSGKIKKLNTIIRKKETKITSLKKQIEKFDQKSQDDPQNKSDRSQINDHLKENENLEDLKNQLFKLNFIVNKTKEENTLLKDQIQKSSTDLDSVKSLLKLSKEEYINLNDQLFNSKLDLDSIKNKLSNLVTEKEDLNLKLKDCLNKINLSEKEKKDIKLENSELKKLNNDLQKKFDQKSQEFLQTKIDLTKKIDQLDVLNEDICKTKLENNHLNSQLKFHFDTHKLLSEAQISLQNELRLAKNEISLFNIKITHYNEEISKLKSDYIRTRDENSKLLEQIKLLNIQSTSQLINSSSNLTNYYGDVNDKKRRHDQKDFNKEKYYHEECDRNLYLTPIKKYFDHLLINNNSGDCPYCPKKSLKNLNIHIGHMHKCKNCRMLYFECDCRKNDLIEQIRQYQATP